MANTTTTREQLVAKQHTSWEWPRAAAEVSALVLLSLFRGGIISGFVMFNPFSELSSLLLKDNLISEF